MSRDDSHLVSNRVQSMQRAKGLCALNVNDEPGERGLLAQPIDLDVVPDRVPRQQDRPVLGAKQDPDAAGRVASQVDEDDRTVAEDVMASFEGQHGRPFEDVSINATP